MCLRVSAWQVALIAAILGIMGHILRPTCNCVQECESEEPFKSLTDTQQRQALVKELHLLKTDLFMKMVEDGMMPLRPGVKRLVSAPPLQAIDTLALRRHTRGKSVKPDRQHRYPGCVLNVALSCLCSQATQAGVPVAAC